MKKAYSNKELLGMKNISAWVDPETHEALKRLAQKEERSLAALITRHLKELVEKSSDALPAQVERME